MGFVRCLLRSTTPVLFQLPLRKCGAVTVRLAGGGLPGGPHATARSLQARWDGRTRRSHQHEPRPQKGCFRAHTCSCSVAVSEESFAEKGLLPKGSAKPAGSSASGLHVATACAFYHLRAQEAGRRKNHAVWCATRVGTRPRKVKLLPWPWGLQREPGSGNRSHWRDLLWLNV